MKLWLDAKREPDVDWVWAKTAQCAIVMLNGGNVEKISFSPDQRKLVEEVVNWLIDTGVDVEREVHKRSDGVKHRAPRLKGVAAL